MKDKILEMWIIMVFIFAWVLPILLSAILSPKISGRIDMIIIILLLPLTAVVWKIILTDTNSNDKEEGM